MPEVSGFIDEYEVQIFGHIKSQDRPCLICQKMIDHGRAIHCERRYMPCRWSNQKRDGHIYEFPEPLAAYYK